jgi:hypothetical protein
MAIMVGLTWIVSAHRIVYASLAPGLGAGAMWKWVPGEFGVERWNWLVLWAQKALADLNGVGFPQWVEFVSVAFQPLALVLAILYVPLVFTLARGRKSVQRRFTPDSLMRLASEKFTGNLPILTLRRQIAANTHPLWRLPVQPEEVLSKWRAPMNSVRAESAGRSICNFKKPAFDDEVARLYFTGLTAPVGGKRLESEMLGRLVVDLVKDAEHSQQIAFADRFSSEGKALVALWAPVCFAGEEGREEYQKLKDALNRSAYGTRDGMANLTLAQEQYNKYRAHPELRSLFAVHHWEYTALFALLKRAQRFGVFTTAEILWLRPMNRILFATMNSCGRHTPHLEGAATFAMHRFEHECARLKRLPLMQLAPGERLQPVVFVNKAIEALRAEFVHLVDAVDEEEDIWVNPGLWKRTNTAVVDWVKQSQAEQAAAAAVAASEGAPDMDNAFDNLMRQQRQEADSRQAAALEEELARGTDF